MQSNKTQTTWMFDVAAVLLAVAGFMAAGPAHALPKNSATRTYYSSATHTQIVGHQFLLECDGGHGEVEGTKTVYFTTKYQACP